MLRYPVKLSRDTNDTILVEFLDVPEAHTFGEDVDEALMQAVDALESLKDEVEGIISSFDTVEFPGW